ncbi:hypothetical protein [Polaribacter ponticola]|uniref:Outer membrane protein beta-barrel domain-containing protein n=1 Tax=Polaribacter ponticola TaxID=2978475 RepID=A0ABT5SAI2_9FLAO|nr:hypothetical protein [Polaribacter sp. MSW5]MDD7915095.1 hypothetical protein [Polaribacter sp. MSW5]
MKINSLVFVLFLSLSLSSQNFDSKWTVGLSLASAKYTDFQGKILGGSFVNQSPRINVSKYLLKGFIADVGLSTAIFDTQKYTTLDAVIRYDFRASSDNVVPYLLIGGSVVSAIKSTPTLNFGVGNTFWLKPNYGVNLQLIYKYSEAKFESQYSHFYPSIGLVYSLEPRNMNPRIWDRKH